MAGTIKTIFYPQVDHVNILVKWINENRVNAHDYRRYPAKHLYIDFSRCSNIRPYDLAPLACLIHEYREKGFTIKCIKVPERIDRYFHSFNFNAICTGEDQNNFPDPLDKAILPLWRINQEAINVYPEQAKDYYERNLFFGLNLFALGASLGELMNNVFDHSLSKIPGYTFTHYTELDRFLITSVCDFGVGIPNKINTYLKSLHQPKVNNKDALKKALSRSFSTKSQPHNKGWGLDNILSIVKQLHGRLLILSNDVVYVYDETNPPPEVIHHLKDSFHGTLVVITLHKDNLLVNEPEEEGELNLF